MHKASGSPPSFCVPRFLEHTYTHSFRERVLPYGIWGGLYGCRYDNLPLDGQSERFPLQSTQLLAISSLKATVLAVSDGVSPTSMELAIPESDCERSIAQSVARAIVPDLNATGQLERNHKWAHLVPSIFVDPEVAAQSALLTRLILPIQDFKSQNSLQICNDQSLGIQTMWRWLPLCGNCWWKAPEKIKDRCFRDRIDSVELGIKSVSIAGDINKRYLPTFGLMTIVRVL